MDYRQIYRDKNGVIWAVTDYGMHRLGDRRRTAQRRRRLLILASIGLAMVVALVIISSNLLGFT